MCALLHVFRSMCCSSIKYHTVAKHSWDPFHQALCSHAAAAHYCVCLSVFVSLSSCCCPVRYEASALTLRSLRRESLCLLSASSKVMCEPVSLLAQALDPPDQDVVAAALDYLQQVISMSCLQ